MNRDRPSKTAPPARRRFRGARGQSYVELAFALPVLALVLVVAADFGRLFYTYLEVINAARAAAQYGSNSVVAAANSAGMIAAAKQDGVNVANLTVTASQCTCATATASGGVCLCRYGVPDGDLRDIRDGVSGVLV